MDHLVFIVITGAGATAIMDLWGFARRPLFGIAPHWL